MHDAQGLLRWPLLVHRRGNAEVEDLDRAALGDEDVVWLEVAVDDALSVSADQRSHHRHDELHGATRAQRPTARQQRRQRVAFEVLEDHVVPPVGLLGLVNDDDVLVAAQGRGPRLGDVPAACLRVGGVEELDGHSSAELGVSRQEDLAHASLAEGANELVATDAVTRHQRRQPEEQLHVGAREHPGGLVRRVSEVVAVLHPALVWRRLSFVGRQWFPRVHWSVSQCSVVCLPSPIPCAVHIDIHRRTHGLLVTKVSY